MLTASLASRSAPEPQPEPNAYKRILIIKLGALGDFIQALGPMAAIRRHHPAARITLLTTQPFAQLGRDCGYVDEVMIDPRPKWLDLGAWLSLRGRLNAGAYDRVYDLQNSDRTAIYLKLFRSRPEWVGVAQGASHRNVSPARTQGHAFDGHVQTLAMAGIDDIRHDTLEWMKGDIAAFPLCRPYILMVPGSSPRHPEKRWPPAHFAALAQQLQKRGYQSVLLGTASERISNAAIAKECPHALDLTGHTSLTQIASLARSAAGAVGNDTGPMHIIAATNCPSVVLFSGQSNPARHYPLGHGVHVLHAPKLSSLPTETVKAALKPRDIPTQGYVLRQRKI